MNKNALENLNANNAMDAHNLIDARINTINFEITNYDSKFILKDIPQHLKGAFKYVFFQEKRKEMLFLKKMIELLEDQDD